MTPRACWKAAAAGELAGMKKEMPLPPPLPLTAAEVAELVVMARSTGPDGMLARVALREGVKTGEIAASSVPAEVLVKAPTAGPSGKIPPRSVGRTHSRPVLASDGPNAPRRTRTYNPLIKSQLLCQLS